uniref:Uncharacterized protein n=2 Tax=Meloidogyne TaxID=189290 RepID=A0A6V7W695_MELEN|nr:unnamed protein product [Meloidogyne enterolobii]
MAMEYLINHQEFTKLCKFLHEQLTNRYHKNDIFKDSSKGVPDKIKNLNSDIFNCCFKSDCNNFECKNYRQIIFRCKNNSNINQLT